MNLKLVFIATLLGGTALLTKQVSGFVVPSQRIVSGAGAPAKTKFTTTTTTTTTRSPTTGTSTTLYVADWVKDSDLFVGMFTIACASTPYALQLVLPKVLNTKFFLPIYTDTIAGREAEIGWKTRFATLGFVCTVLTFKTFYLGNQMSTDLVLRDQYLAWAIFYADAAYDIYKQARMDPPVYAKDTRFGIQLWHVLVTVVLLANTSESYTGHAISNAIASLIGAN
ncbi:hypothetical protein FRACYDRAFT_241077 [Fragilariopsis cylindrus CCMP1102]|uniref:Uncharacterized protein n=1 Tax=Fragilariopsis cylindrus CCMP1102 TaxID=635003 RepID=A0A1E7F8N3_9STRA|nr:hypothetical protein FRACYDRAFT_241077 [Fragilariopsis cylindrus CCMP1102]|eukprot:OEU14531.1 hypothetical protein FRACYDRAFT_241077 [Fragilariopsis cylindrus CCMP1102]